MPCLWSLIWLNHVWGSLYLIISLEITVMVPQSTSGIYSIKLNLGNDCLELCFWTVALKTILTKHNSVEVLFLKLTPKLYFKAIGFVYSSLIFITQKANTCRLWTPCFLLELPNQQKKMIKVREKSSSQKIVLCNKFNLHTYMHMYIYIYVYYIYIYTYIYIYIYIYIVNILY